MQVKVKAKTLPQGDGVGGVCSLGGWLARSFPRRRPRGTDSRPRRRRSLERVGLGAPPPGRESGRTSPPTGETTRPALCQSGRGVRLGGWDLVRRIHMGRMVPVVSVVSV